MESRQPCFHGLSGQEYRPFSELPNSASLLSLDAYLPEQTA